MHHGEVKTPGGKLIAVDFTVDGDALRNVQVHGDFFLYPEDALEDLSGALEGAPASLGEADLAARVASRLRPGAELIGSSPEALALAVRRALASAEESA